MYFAENGRVSHRQLYRQMILALTAPLLLCLFGERKLWGIGGIFGTVIAVILLLFYVIFLIRLAPYYEDVVKIAGGFAGRAIGIYFLVYVILTGAYLLNILEEIVPKTLVMGVPGKWISLAAILVCSMGTHRGMQKRGRIAEVSGGFLLGGIALMMVICISQGKAEYLRGILTDGGDIRRNLLYSGYEILCAFSVSGLLPFLLEDVEKQGSAGKTVLLSVLTLGTLLVGMELILPSVFGMERLAGEEYPVLPLLSGADLPGNVLARFDVIWMGFLLYSLFFAIGSLLHYGHLIVKKTHLGTGRIWIAAGVYFLSVMKVRGIEIEDFFESYLAYIFVPGLLLIQIFLFWKGRNRWKKHVVTVTSAVTLCLFLGGCAAAVEPENRLYPLALGVDFTENGYRFIYGIPDLAKATGQEKSGEEGAEVLELTGKDFEEIEENYNRSQDKFLDMGHLEVLILGDSMLQNDRWMNFLEYLSQKPFVGEDIYIFLAENAYRPLSWSSPDGTTIGEYLTGMLENRMTGQKIREVTLREVLYEKYENRILPELPVVRVINGNIEVV